MKHKLRTLHFIGIGGSGMSGIAEVLLNLGFQVSGSDINDSSTTRRLQKLGAKIYIGHHERNIKNVDAVIVSSAVSVDNPEIRKARKKDIPVVARAVMLSELMRMRQSIAVAGSHGKTTSTSLIAAVLAEAGLDPTYVIGGLLNAAGVNAKLGKGEYIVVEADESDRSFLNLYPMITMITNIDRDHLENYNQDFVELKKAFIDFVGHLPFYGLAVICTDDPGVNDILPFISRPKATYGLKKGADYQAVKVKALGRQMHFQVLRENGKPLNIVLNHPGIHNVINSLGTIAVADELGVADVHIVNALAKFTGIGRRVEELGTINTNNSGQALVIEDYGHHPTEVSATVKAIDKAYPQQNKFLVFQPHRYSRTRDCFNDFVRVFVESSKNQMVILTDVYPAGEKVIASATGESLYKSIIREGANKKNILYVEKVEDVPDVLSKKTKDGDVCLVMGAGTIGGVMKKHIKASNKKNSNTTLNSVRKKGS